MMQQPPCALGDQAKSFDEAAIRSGTCNARDGLMSFRQQVGRNAEEPRMRDPSDPADRTAALVMACLMDAARGRARTAAPLRVRGPGALPLMLAQGLFTAVAALAVLRLFHTL
jgi:hypothetical protein